ncbi:levanbiose-producing levanase [Paenibacillus sophorae]|uniref:GH32 C-terminal domain-containing protein n=1 Tax=Paenibacillus sophorae TaxID=1333845 RepID=A0A1H8U868_9BACL|nr:GH32 C-terminal domain-containing protein [Paenibacillus sophorae]QWU17999.1 GH32 C-terminal domain-containing protein [Paenibacillus sophorae]SEO99460.1 levanbiose-producing levanase [Paenibacillus sophorae]
MKRSSFKLTAFLLALALGLSGLYSSGSALAAGWAGNTPGYLPVSGTWTQDGTNGLRGVSSGSDNAFNMSTTSVGTNFVYEADVKVDASSPHGVASLVFRASADGSKGYVLSLDPNLDRIRLFDYATGTDLATPFSKTMSDGSSYHLKIAADGSSLKVYADSAQAFSVSDTKYSSGLTGFHVYNGTAYFQNVYVNVLNTNVTGWNASGTWNLTSQGWKGTAASNQNITAISATSSNDFSYESDVQITDPYALGTLLFRSNADGTQAYGLQIDPNQDRLRLYKTDGNVTLAQVDTQVDSGKVYHVRIKAQGSSIKIYWQYDFLNPTGYNPLLTVTDTSYTQGFAGIGVYNGSAVFQNILISTLKTNLEGWTASGGGSWIPQLGGFKGTSSGSSDTYNVVGAGMSDFVLEGDLSVDNGTSHGTAGLVFRAASASSGGYVLNIDPNLDRVRLFNRSGGSTIATANMNIDTGRVYHIEIIVSGSSIKVYVDGGVTPLISATDSAYTSGVIGLNAFNGTAYFQNIYAADLSQYYNETYRPQYHFTETRNRSSDPNGLVYYQGEYHMFHQQDGEWAHAVSTDLVHWKHLPLAIPRNDAGDAWSGGAVADLNNVSGLFPGGSGIIAYYTSFNPEKPNGNQKIHIAYSSDKGRTWTDYANNPVVENPGGSNGGWDFRDPKIVWDADHSKWVMVVSGNDNVRFYTSTNLLNWTYASAFGYGAYLHGGIMECPDLFQLPVDGNAANKKWVLVLSTGAVPATHGSASEYFVGSFDGTTFTSDNPAATVLRTEQGKDMYAAMTFDGIPAADGRRISIGWMSNWDYPFSFPTSPWNGQMSVPRELKLTDIAGTGIRLTETPVAEMDALRGAATSINNVTVTPSSANPLATVTGTAYEIDAVLELPTGSTASEFGFHLREGGGQKTVVGYKTGSSEMFVDRSSAGADGFTANFHPVQSTVLPLENGRVKMRIYVDQSSVEAFGNDGKAVFSDMIFPGSARTSLSFYTSGGDVKIVSLNAYPLDNVWRSEPASGSTPQKVVMDQTRVQLAAGSIYRLYADVLPRSASNKTLVWSSSNPAVASVAQTDSVSTDVTAVAQGRAVITATTQAGGIVSSTVVEVGSFTTNLTGWNSTPADSWTVTGDGVSGTFDKDSNYMSGVSGTDFTYEADVKLDRAGGAGSMIFRANADGSSGYYFNIDPNIKALRLFYKLNGGFSSSQMLAGVPAAIISGTAYHVKVVTSGTNIKVYFDGASTPVIDVNDATFTSGYFGLNVFGGTASYQNVNKN